MIFPPRELIYNAFANCTFDNVRVVIIGQGVLSCSFAFAAKPCFCDPFSIGRSRRVAVPSPSCLSQYLHFNHLCSDPYHGRGQAEGLCFSVAKGVAIPPSLRNMCARCLPALQHQRQRSCLFLWFRYKELETDIPGFKAPSHGSLAKYVGAALMAAADALSSFFAVAPADALSADGHRKACCC
jgi:hypothetical protein